TQHNDKACGSASGYQLSREAQSDKVTLSWCREKCRSNPACVYFVLKEGTACWHCSGLPGDAVAPDDHGYAMVHGKIDQLCKVDAGTHFVGNKIDLSHADHMEIG
ncbi:unnamed protein product, partial [Amoebophrya sp. A25]